MGTRPSDFDLTAKEMIAGRISGKKPSEADILFVQKMHNSRSARARGVDESMTKNVTNIVEVWQTDPARFDFMGVDTKKPNKKKRGRKS